MWTGSGQGQVESSCETAGKLSSVLTTRDLSSSAQLHGVSYTVLKEQAVSC
jgi:hypothetical protein